MDCIGHAACHKLYSWYDLNQWSCGPVLIQDFFSECVTAVNVSVKDQLTLSVSVAVSSTIVSVSHFFPNVHRTNRCNVSESKRHCSLSRELFRHYCSTTLVDIIYRFMVLLGSIIGKPLPLLFDPFESVVRQRDSWAVHSLTHSPSLSL